MTYKLYIKSVLLFLISIILFSIINTNMYYFNIIDKSISNIISIISIILTSIFTGIYIGLKSKNKAYINSSIVSLIITSITLAITIISKNLSLVFFLAYMTISLLMIMSSIITINKKGNSN